MSRTIDLEIFKNEQLVGSTSLTRDVIKIGKLRSSDLFLEDDSVARMHAVLEVTDSDLRLVDLGSATGTSINGRRVEKSAAMSVGDSLTVGPYRLEVKSIGPAATVMTAAQAPFGATAAPRVEMSSIAAAPAMPAAAPPTTVAPRATLPVSLDEVEDSEHHVAEVIASYGGTVLDVRHVGQVRNRRRQAPAMFAVGAMMLLAGAGVLANEVNQDWESYQAARDEAATLGRAAPEAPGTGLGGLGIGLALLGLVPFGLGMARRDDVGLEKYTLGETHDATFHVPTEGLPGSDEAFALVSRHGDDYLLRFTPEMKGEVTIGGQRMDLAELASSGRAGMAGSSYAFPLPSGAKARVEHAGVSYQISSVPKGRAMAGRSETDKPFWAYNAASFGVLGGLLALVHLIPEDALSMSVDELTAENRYVGYMNQPDLTPEPEPEEEIVPTEVADDKGGEGKRHAGDEGKMGKPSAETKSGLYAIKGPKNAMPTMARDFDPEMAARQAGILGMMESNSGHFIASPYGSIASGNDEDDIWGGLTGTEVGTAFGVGGMGVIGTGRGGGGNGEGTIGLGQVGTIGRGGGGGGLAGYGRGSGIGFGGKTKRAPKIRRGKAKISGVIDKDIIRRIVRNHHNEVRHCYNQGLAKDPNLRGRVAVMFTIGPRGTVPTAAVTESTLGDANVGRCVAKSVKRWKFPKPSSGGSAMVTYPFSFSPG
ncbi:MAG: TonB family protein [Myxococcota bacterium]